MIVDEMLSKLLSGDHCCLCGVPGKTRTLALEMMRDRAAEFGFDVVIKDALEVPDAHGDWAVYRDLLRAEISTLTDYTMFVFDNCDRAFSSLRRQYLERVLSLLCFSGTLDPRRLCRVVIIAGSRDFATLGLSPDIRERCSVFWVSEIAQPPVLAALTELEFSQICGSLRYEERARCAQIFCAAISPPSVTWRADDRRLHPLVAQGANGNAMPNPHLEAWQQSVLSDPLWPSCDPFLSAHRFSSLLGFECNPLWVDRYLATNTVGAMPSFLSLFENVFRLRPDIGTFHILTRIRSQGLLPGLRSSISNLLGSVVWGSKIEWKAYVNPNQDPHDRHLVLRHRAEAYTLPPADRILGINAVVNETDSWLNYPATLPERQLWSSALRVFP